MPQSPPPYCRFKKLSYNHTSRESASPRQEVELPMRTKREPTNVFRMFAAVPVPVNNEYSGIFICDVEFTVVDWCRIAKTVERIHAGQWPIRALCGHRSKLIERLQDTVANALEKREKRIIPPCSIQLMAASTAGIGITVAPFSEQILDVDLNTDRPPRVPTLSRSHIKLPCLDEMRACLGRWRVTDCYWEYLRGLPESTRWLLQLGLKRDSYSTTPATVIVELRSIGDGVIEVPVPVGSCLNDGVDRHVLATFSQDVRDLFGIYPFGAFHFKAYMKSGKVGRGFALRIRIFELGKEETVL